MAIFANYLWDMKYFKHSVVNKERHCVSLKCIKMLTWGQRGSSSQQAPTVTVSEQYLNNIYSISTQYLHNTYTVSTQYLHNIYTVSIQYLHNIYSPSTWVWPVELPSNNSGHWSDGGCFGAKYDSHFALLVCRDTSTFVLKVEWNFSLSYLS